MKIGNKDKVKYFDLDKESLSLSFSFVKLLLLILSVFGNSKVFILLPHERDLKQIVFNC